MKHGFMIMTSRLKPNCHNGKAEVLRLSVKIERGVQSTFFIIHTRPIRPLSIFFILQAQVPPRKDEDLTKWDKTKKLEELERIQRDKK